MEAWIGNDGKWIKVSPDPNLLTITTEEAFCLAEWYKLAKCKSPKYDSLYHKLFEFIDRTWTEPNLDPDD